MYTNITFNVFIIIFNCRNAKANGRADSATSTRTKAPAKDRKKAKDSHLEVVDLGHHELDPRYVDSLPTGQSAASNTSNFQLQLGLLDFMIVSVFMML